MRRRIRLHPNYPFPTQINQKESIPGIFPRENFLLILDNSLFTVQHWDDLEMFDCRRRYHRPFLEARGSSIIALCTAVLDVDDY